MASILTEVVDFQSIENKVISESVGEGKTTKNTYLIGPHLQSEIKNHNGRIYPRAIIEREVKKINETKIKDNRFIGELEHPEQLAINLERVSHITTMLKMEGNDAVGKTKLLDTPLGMVAKKLIEGGVKLGVSSRGSGTLKESIVQSDFNLLCVDIISDPSGPNCFMDSILESKTEWVMENGILTEKEIQTAKHELDKIIVEHTFSIEDRRSAFLKLFNDTLNTIGKKHF